MLCLQNPVKSTYLLFSLHMGSTRANISLIKTEPRWDNIHSSQPPKLQPMDKKYIYPVLTYFNEKNKLMAF